MRQTFALCLNSFNQFGHVPSMSAKTKKLFLSLQWNAALCHLTHWAVKYGNGNKKRVKMPCLIRNAVVFFFLFVCDCEKRKNLQICRKLRCARKDFGELIVVAKKKLKIAHSMIWGGHKICYANLRTIRKAFLFFFFQTACNSGAEQQQQKKKHFIDNGTMIKLTKKKKMNFQFRTNWMYLFEQLRHISRVIAFSNAIIYCLWGHLKWTIRNGYKRTNRLTLRWFRNCVFI